MAMALHELSWLAATGVPLAVFQVSIQCTLVFIIAWAVEIAPKALDLCSNLVQIWWRARFG